MGIFPNLRQSSPTTTIKELEREVESLREQLRITSLNLSMMTAKCKSLERNRPYVTPIGDIDEGYECPECGESVTEDYNNFCQRCGVELNWNWSPPCDEDAFDRWADR